MKLVLGLVMMVLMCALKWVGVEQPRGARDGMKDEEAQRAVPRKRGLRVLGLELRTARQDEQMASYSAVFATLSGVLRYCQIQTEMIFDGRKVAGYSVLHVN